MEIEKKYKIDKLPDNLEQYDKKEIEQGYLCVKPVVRIRKSNEDYILTFKAPYKDDEKKEKVAIVNNEIEMPLTKEAYIHLKEKVDNNIITKTRYLVPLEGGLVGELDVFHGALEGLVFIEVEFSSEEEASRFKPPTWFKKDVSFDKKYKNNYLSKINSYSEFCSE
jgi:adenylate cyclase